MEHDFLVERMRMVAVQIRGRGITDEQVLAAFESVPRHLFVPTDSRDWAYDDGPLPIGFGQTISQPYIVAYMTEALSLSPSDHVLEIGTGSGYQAAILSGLVHDVHSVEMVPALAERAELVLAGLNMKNVSVHVGDGSVGLPDFAPYDAIIVTAAAPHVPKGLLAQLSGAGRMILPIGSSAIQNLELWRRSGDSFSREPLLSVAFVPLRGADGVDGGTFGGDANR